MSVSKFSSTRSFIVRSKARFWGKRDNETLKTREEARRLHSIRSKINQMDRRYSGNGTLKLIFLRREWKFWDFIAGWWKVFVVRLHLLSWLWWMDFIQCESFSVEPLFYEQCWKTFLTFFKFLYYTDYWLETSQWE